jgi:hypothetical protein
MSLSAHVGDVANRLSLVLTFAFLFTYFLKPQVFASSYLQDGFCVSWQDTMFNSHLLCFYVDTIFTVLLLVLCYLTKRGSEENPAAMTRVRDSFLGVFGHGIGHLSLHIMARDRDRDPWDRDLQTQTSQTLEKKELSLSASDPFSAGVAPSPLSIGILFAILFFWLGFFWSFSKSLKANFALSAINTIGKCQNFIELQLQLQLQLQLHLYIDFFSFII